MIQKRKNTKTKQKIHKSEDLAHSIFLISGSRANELNLKKEGSWSHWFLEEGLNFKKER